MIPKIKNLIQNYQKVELYFDNDNAGNRAVEMIKNAGDNIEDCRNLYSDFKDINDWLVNDVQQEEKLSSTLVQKVPKVYNKRIR